MNLQIVANIQNLPIKHIAKSDRFKFHSFSAEIRAWESLICGSCLFDQQPLTSKLSFQSFLSIWKNHLLVASGRQTTNHVFYFRFTIFQFIFLLLFLGATSELAKQISSVPTDGTNRENVTPLFKQSFVSLVPSFGKLALIDPRKFIVC